ncbi:FtsX-like permease family protein [Nocardia sp. CDC159]|uniref:FtsX-like permease family protein n=1 Tax=Nocardia pulmonis TaxID=2951408 RepID=A0A9X2J036_9NOCA|nr:MULTISPECIES: FtsX-like permease family protein [Nocardia]MCM6775601.1 FtsX-like permease family protein [Nocardia pulmonis]MCM6787665.1 FtsX-like permease family protein [Nocardia sp. CDC159]
MNTLHRKLFRDIRTQWAQFAALTVVVLLGVALFTAAYGAYRNLTASYDRVFATQRFADLWVSGGDATAFAAAARTDPQVADASVRRQVELPLRVGADKLRGRVIGLPADGPPASNAPTLLSGRAPAANEVLVEHHLADHFRLRAGDVVAIHGTDGWVSASVAGVVSSAEYLWPARDRADLFPLPDNFGVVFAPDPLVAAVAPGGPEQALVRYTGSAGPDTAARLHALAQRYGAEQVVDRAEQPSNWLLRLDIDAFGELAYLFPLLFLTVAMLVAYVLLNRRVRAERPVIGVLLAGGRGRGSVLAHYISYGALAGGLGALGGMVLGQAASGALTNLYVGAIDLPREATVVQVVPLTLIGAPILGIGTGVLGALAPALLAFRTPPAAAMRGVTPAHPGRISLAERLIPPLRRLPVRWLLVLRNVGRAPRRTWSTVLGTVLALLLVLTSWTLLDTMTAALRISSREVQTADVRVDFTAPVDRARVAELTGAPGVRRAEPMVQLPVTLTAGSRTYSTALIALTSGTEMHGFRPLPGSPGALSGDGLLVGKGIRALLGVGAGDVVTVNTPGAQPVSVPIAGLLDEPIGTFVYASLDRLDVLAGAPVPVNAALLRLTPGADPRVVRETLSERAEIAAVEDLTKLERLIDEYADLFYVFIGAMLALGGALAFAIIFTTMSINIVERRREVAVLRAGGMSHAVVARLLTGENLLVTLLGVGPGLVLGVLGGREFLALYTNDQIQIDLVVRPATLIVAAAAVLIVAVVSLLPGLRAVRGLDLAAVVRERSD